MHNNPVLLYNCEISILKVDDMRRRYNLSYYDPATIIAFFGHFNSLNNFSNQNTVEHERNDIPNIQGRVEVGVTIRKMSVYL